MSNIRLGYFWREIKLFLDENFEFKIYSEDFWIYNSDYPYNKCDKRGEVLFLLSLTDMQTT
jgi:hypothetical protein